MKEENQVENNSKVFEYLGCISFVATMFICAVARPLFNVLFSEAYHRAFIVSPYLFLAPLLQMLFQVACNQFLVIKKTWPNMFILSFGAVANIALNFLLIPIIGIEGASIATMIGYAISDIVCVLVLKRMNLIVLSNRFILSLCLFIASFFFWRMYLSLKAFGYSLLVAFVIAAIIAWLYRKELSYLEKSIRKENG